MIKENKPKIHAISFILWEECRSYYWGIVTRPMNQVLWLACLRKCYSANFKRRGWWALATLNESLCLWWVKELIFILARALADMGFTRSFRSDPLIIGGLWTSIGHSALWFHFSAFDPYRSMGLLGGLVICTSRDFFRIGSGCNLEINSCIMLRQET